MAFGRKYDQRLSQRLPHLPPQGVKDLRAIGRVENLKIILGGQLQNSLDSRARVLGSSTFEAVRQQ